MKILNGLGGAAAGILLLTCFPAFTLPASATEGNQLAEMRAWYTEAGVGEATADNLVDKFSKGELPNSASESAQPADVSVGEEDGWIVTRSTYPDGSIALTYLELPAAEGLPDSASGLSLQSSDEIVTPMSVGECSSSSTGSGYVSYTDCAVYEYTDLLTMSFRANYTRTSSGDGFITYVSSPYVYTSGGSAPTPTLTITRSQGNVATPAQARAVTQFSGISGSFTAYLYLNVHGGSAWSSKSGW